jgi:PAS domain S-box-containing protein
MKKKVILSVLILFLLNVLAATGISKLEQQLRQAKGKEKIELLNQITQNLLPQNLTEAAIYNQQSKELCKTIKNDKLCMITSFLHGKILRLEDDFLPALQLQMQLKQQFKQKNIPEWLAKCWRELGEIYFFKTNIEESEFYFKKLIEYYTSKEDYESVKQIYNRLASAYTKGHRYKKAMKAVLKSLEYDAITNHEAFNILSVIYVNQNNLQQALKLQKRSLKVREEKQLSDEVAKSYVNLGVIYRKLGKTEKALEYYKKSEQYSKKEGDISNLIFIYNNIGYLYATNLHNSAQAKEYYDKSLKLSYQIGDETQANNTLTNIAKLQIENGNLAKAEKNLKKALDLVQNIGSFKLISDTYEQLTNLYEKQGKTKQALLTFKKYNSYKDSLAAYKNDNKFRELMIKYESQEQENLNRIYQLELAKEKQKNLYLFITIAVAIAALAIFIFAYIIRWRSEQKLQKEITKRKQIENNLENEIEAKTAELSEQLQKSEDQRIATTVLLQDLNKTTAKLGDEIEERRKTQADLQALLENTEISFVLINPDLTIRSFNSKAIDYSKKVFGTSIEIGESILDFTLAETKDGFKNNLKKCLQGETTKLDLGLPTNDPQMWFNFSYIPVKDINGKVTGVLFSSLNITKRKQVENALAESERKYKALFQTAAEGILAVDLEQDKFSFANSSMCKMLGYSEEELKTMKPKDIHPTSLQNEILSDYEKQVKQEISFAPAIPCLRKNGRIIYTNITSVNTKINGKIYHIGFFTDVTNRKKAEAQLIQSEKRFRTLVNTLPDYIWLKDTEGIYLNCNPKFEEFLGHSESEIIGKTDYDFLPKKLANFFRNKDKEAMKANKSIMNEEEITRKIDSKHVLLETTKTPMYNEDGSVIGILGIGHDITERKKIENELRDKMTQLRRLNNAMTGREERMIELKQKINELSKKLDEEPPYNLDFMDKNNDK